MPVDKYLSQLFPYMSNEHRLRKLVYKKLKGNYFLVLEFQDIELYII